MKRTSTLLGTGLGLLLALLAGAAAGQTPPAAGTNTATPAAAAPAAAPPADSKPNPESKALFDAGAKAYQAGDFKAAIQAFEQAYKVDQRPGLLFSIAQAHRRQYAVDRRAGHIAVALKYFRDYVVTVAQGGRRADAVQALNELEPIVQQLQRDGQLQPLEDSAPSTRLVVSSPTAEATITLDAEKESRPLPFIGEVTPGKHTFRIARAGFGTEERTVEVASGGVTALDIGLTELPAKVEVRGPAGASAWVDGRPAGRLPLSAPIEVAPGRHDVRVSLSGYEEHREELDLPRGGSQSVAATMRLTLQRKLAFGLAGTGALALVTGAVLGGVALAEQGTASGIKNDIDAGKVVCRAGVCPQLDSYNSAVDARNALGGASGALLGTGALFAASGVLLYLFDSPAPILPVRPSGEETPKSTAPKGDAPLDLGFAPVLGPGLAGGTMQFRF
ncbi:MAG: PEGA domain-containing protein [Polyangiaceae bacterium]